MSGGGIIDLQYDDLIQTSEGILCLKTFQAIMVAVVPDI
jgi:hypothetical protein